jgi:hypothetical protein
MIRKFGLYYKLVYICTKINLKILAMDNESLTPEESIALITRTIQQTKYRFVENGHILIMWGVLICAASLAQFILLRLEHYTINYFPYFIMPLGGVYTYLYYGRKQKKNNLPVTIIGRILRVLGTVLGINFLVLGFIYWKELGAALFPIFFIFLALLVIIMGAAIKFKPFLIGGIILNLTGFALFFVELEYHPVIMSAAAVITIVIPGLILNRTKSNQQ